VLGKLLFKSNLLQLQVTCWKKGTCYSYFVTYY